MTESEPSGMTHRHRNKKQIVRPRAELGASIIPGPTPETSEMSDREIEYLSLVGENHLEREKTIEKRLEQLIKDVVKTHSRTDTLTVPTDVVKDTVVCEMKMDVDEDRVKDKITIMTLSPNYEISWVGGRRVEHQDGLII